mmetsp:Transcript_11228/g.14641  ORF Transcript_11228/g.14641 Transcript_11228/m.14641 type:complete len:263 (+) Transcript_11228:887-1675(+)
MLPRLVRLTIGWDFLLDLLSSTLKPAQAEQKFLPLFRLRLTIPFSGMRAPFKEATKDREKNMFSESKLLKPNQTAEKVFEQSPLRNRAAPGAKEVFLAIETESSETTSGNKALPCASRYFIYVAERKGNHDEEIQTNNASLLRGRRSCDEASQKAAAATLSPIRNDFRKPNYKKLGRPATRFDELSEESTSDESDVESSLSFSLHSEVHNGANESPLCLDHLVVSDAIDKEKKPLRHDRAAQIVVERADSIANVHEEEKKAR